jgi:hypothetical protein
MQQPELTTLPSPKERERERERENKENKKRYLISK